MLIRNNQNFFAVSHLHILILTVKGCESLPTFYNDITIRPLSIQIIRTLSKPRRRQQRGRGKTKDLVGRTIAQHVCFKTLYIS